MPIVRRRRARFTGVVAVLFVLSAIGQWPGAQAAQEPVPRGPGDASAILYEGVLPAERAAVVAETAGRLSRYRIEADLLPAAPDGSGRITGTVDLRFVNATGDDLGEVYFRLYSNDPRYTEGALAVADVRVAGSAVTPELSVDDTVLRVPLPSPLATEAATDLTLTFEAAVPVQPEQSYGIFASDPENGSWALAHWFPILAGYDAHGWSLDPVSRNGDPIFSTAALFDVALTAPADLVLVTSGRAIEETTEDDLVRRRYVTGPVRDFTIVADDDFASVSREVNGTTVTSYYNPGSEAGGADVLAFGAQSLAIYNGLFGVYPYVEMDLVQVELQGAAGVEFPQLMLMGDGLYGNRSGLNPDWLEFVAVHEVANQWWYGLVGNNQHLDAFIDEGLAEYASSAIYFGEQYGPAEGQEQYELEVLLRYFGYLFERGDEVVDQPTDAFPSSAAYNAMVYGKAAVGFDALRAEIGDEAFDAGLQDYYRRFRFGVATPPDLLAALERAAGRELDETWRHWFEAAEGRQVFDEQDYLDLLVDLGLR